jgi:uncharacterized protein
MARKLMIAAGAVVGLYVLACVLVFVFEARLIFQPPEITPEGTPASAGLAFEDLHIPVAGGGQIHAWWVPAAEPTPAVILFFHGNGYSLESEADSEAPMLHRTGANLLLADYRGYGASSKLHPDGPSTAADARAALRYLLEQRHVPLADIYIAGRSIGTGVATQLATETPGAGGLILISPFTSVIDVGDQSWVYRVLFRPVRWMGHANDFDNRKKISAVHMPVLIMTGSQDELATPTMAKTLYDNAKKPKAMQLIDGADHNTIGLVGAAPLAQAIQTFIAFASAAPSRAITSAAASPLVLDLWKKVQSPETTDDATDRLETLAESDTKIRNYLAEQVPALVGAGPAHYQPKIPDSAVQYPGPVWRNAVKLARDLNITEAAPELVKWISISTGHMLGLTSETELTYNPAGQALIEMGDASAPALRDGLDGSAADEMSKSRRLDCSRALLMIGSPRAIDALRDYAARGTDKAVVDDIKRGLASQR